MTKTVGPAVVIAVALLHASPKARADDAGTVALAGSDFTLTLSRVDASGRATVLTNDELRTAFSAARCACPTNVVAGLTLSPEAAAQLGTHGVDAQLAVGSDCDNSSAVGCKSLGATLTLSAGKRASTQTITTDAIFGAAGASCGATSTSSSRLWAIVRLDGARLATQPSLPITLGGTGPKAPTNVKVQAGDEGLLVSWTATGDSTVLQGHQVLCSPGPAKASDARYDTCPATAPDDAADPFAALDARLVCSDLVPVGTSSTRVHGLENGRATDIAVVAVGVDGTPSSPSKAAQGTPGPTFGFKDLYQDGGGTAQGGCSVGGDASSSGSSSATSVLMLGLASAVAGAVLRVRRRRRRSRWARGAVIGALAVGVGASSAAHAQPFDETSFDAQSLTLDADAPAESPRTWNLELRFAPYRPDVDREFAERGSSARPFEQLFSSSRRLMTQLELDRQLVHRFGTWALGLSIGYYRAAAPALAADLTTPSGDETALRLVPLSAALVYRADQLRQRFGSPLVPYAKAGLDCTLWRATDTSQPAASGRTFGWHAAAGLTLDLAVLDPEAGQSMDRETGVNQTALFFEVTRYRLDGFGSDSALRVGDTTWFAGLMLEL